MKHIKSCVLICFFIFLAVFFTRLAIYHYQLITYPYPNEFREGAMLLTTDLMVSGQKPFMWDIQPQNSNVYGIFYHVVVYPFAVLFTPSNAVHRFVSGFFILASCVILFLVLYRRKVPAYYSLSACLLFYAVLLFPGTSTPFAGPHSLGLFLFLSSIFIPWFKKYSSGSLILSGLCGLLAFYSKAYFVLGVPMLMLYLFLFHSKKKAILYGVGWVICFFVSVFFINQIFECYFNNTLMAQMHMGQNNLEHCLKQFAFFYEKNWELLIIVGLGLLLQIKNIKKINRYFIPDLNLFCLICSVIMLYFKFARHGGSWMAYLFQLMSPFFLIFVFTRLKSDLWRMLTIPLIVMNVLSVSKQQLLVKSETSLKSWNTVSSIVAHYDKVYNSPAIVSVVLDKNKPIYNSGLSDCFRAGVLRDTAVDRILSRMFLNDDRVAEMSDRFLSDMTDRVSEQYFDVLILTQNWGVMLPHETERNYKQVGMIDVSMPYFPQQWRLSIWLPKK